jgi:hypothetical protein
MPRELPPRERDSSQETTQTINQKALWVSRQEAIPKFECKRCKLAQQQNGLITQNMKGDGGKQYTSYERLKRGVISATNISNKALYRLLVQTPT